MSQWVCTLQTGWGVHYLQGWDKLWGAGKIIFGLYKTYHGIFRRAIKMGKESYQGKKNVGK